MVRGRVCRGRRGRSLRPIQLALLRVRASAPESNRPAVFQRPCSGEGPSRPRVPMCSVAEQELWKIDVDSQARCAVHELACW
jgi:hypothetical protein